MTLSMTSSEKKAIDTIRCLAMDGVQKANSGHPGTAMALAPITYLLYNERMKYDQNDPRWLGRDRFILSVGHASMLIYSTLHLAGIAGGKHDAPGRKAITLDDLKSFRQMGSRCAGHPEYGHVPGVEMTTGPLGAGVATSVGIAMADRWLADRYNKPEFPLFNSNVYAVCGDGDMMEGIVSEAASLAGHLRLANLCWIYDDNKITIEGDTSLAFTESVRDRFRAYQWNVIEVDDVNDLPALRAAFDQFEATDDRPTLIIVQTRIAFGAPTKEGTEEAHGAPLGAEEIAGAKKFYGFDENVSFAVDSDVYETFNEGLGQRGAALRSNWNKIRADYAKNWSELSEEIEALAQELLPNNWDAKIETFPTDPKGVASRASGGKVLNQIAAQFPWLLGGSADLAPSNCTFLKFAGAGEFTPNSPGRNIHFGVREHAMAAITNGLVLSGLRGYCATFFVFADYLRPMIRLAALMRIPTLFIFTHDSIGVGEDGPTHQPIEHLASLRAIPNFAVFRPADANEVVESYRAALNLKETPSAIVLTRQNLPTVDREKYGPASGVSRGGYVLADAESPKLTFLATGSEVSLCLTAHEKLLEEGIPTRVVSLPCWELFEQQSPEYKASVLPEGVPRIGVELGIEQGWHKYIGNGTFLGMNDFGLSAPVGELLKHFGFTVDHLIQLAKKQI